MYIRTTPLRRIGGVKVQLFRRLKYIFVKSDTLRARVDLVSRKKLLLHREVTGVEKSLLSLPGNLTKLARTLESI